MRLITALVTIALASMAQAEQVSRIIPLSNTEVIEHIRSELPEDIKPDQRTRSLSMFESLDVNRDDEVTLSEMRRHPSLASSFHQLDLNNDGVLDRREIQPLQKEVTGLRAILTLSALRII